MTTPKGQPAEAGNGGGNEAASGLYPKPASASPGTAIESAEPDQSRSNTVPVDPATQAANPSPSPAEALSAEEEAELRQAMEMGPPPGSDPEIVAISPVLIKWFGRLFATLDATRAELAAAVEALREAERRVRSECARGLCGPDDDTGAAARMHDVATNLATALASLSASAAAYRRSVLVEGAALAWAHANEQEHDRAACPICEMEERHLSGSAVSVVDAKEGA